MCHIIWCICVFSSLIFIIGQVQNIQVDVKQGALKGVSLKSRNGTNYFAFYGIPFAKPPVGELRFQSPQEPIPWNGVRDATIIPSPCIQTSIFRKITNPDVVGLEDCLYLHVFTPMIVSRKLPVLVFLHGGSFNGGSAPTGAQYFMDHHVVLVTIQYRLNLFGFLSASDAELPGNYGLKDQVAALQWIRQNVNAFGGDSEKVTIFGESAGAGSVHLHMHSQLSKGLFHRAISQSGSALAPWALTTSHMARDRALAVGVLTGCSTISTRVLVKCLKKLPAAELVKAHNKFHVWDNVPLVPFSPVVEPMFVKGAFLTKNPWKHQAVNEVPWINGMNSGEGAFAAIRYLSNANLLTSLNENYRRIFPIVLMYYGYRLLDGAQVTSTITESVRQFYFGGSKLSTKNAKQLVNILTDAFFTRACLEAARRYRGTVFLYYYDHRSNETLSRLFGDFNEEDLGVCHGDDLLSLFYLPGFSMVNGGPDLAVSQRMIKYWVNFAYTGNPSGNQADSWAPVSSNNLEYLHITTKKDVMKKNLLKERYNLWTRLLPTIPWA